MGVYVSRVVAGQGGFVCFIFGVGGRGRVCIVGHFLQRCCFVLGVFFCVVLRRCDVEGVLTVLFVGVCGRHAYLGCWCGLGLVALSVDVVSVLVLRRAMPMLFGFYLLTRCQARMDSPLFFPAVGLGVPF